MISVNIK